MVEVFLICAIAISIVGGVSVPIGKILFTTYSEERKRLESGGEPRFPLTYIQPEIEESSSPKYSPDRKTQEVNNRN
jgi:hypothetical protein